MPSSPLDLLSHDIKTGYINHDSCLSFSINIKMKLLSNLTLVGLITAAPSSPKDQADPVNVIKEAESMRQTTMRVNIQHWEMGVAASDSIAQRFLDRTENGPATMSQRSFDHSLLRFKLLMGMMVWSHQSRGIKFHNNLPELGFHLTVSLRPLLNSNMKVFHCLLLAIVAASNKVNCTVDYPCP